MTDREIIHTEQAPVAIGPYSQAILCDGWLHCSGQVALDPATGEVVPGGVAEQTERALDNLRAVLAAAGADFSDVVRATVYMTDLSQFGVLNEVYGRAFGDSRPARATVEVSALPKGALVEIDCIARVG